MSRNDRPPDEQMLCVSIHDVAPATWADCLRLVEAVRAVADIPLTWLVVPHYHFRPEQSPAMEACLNVALERGDELALHGYSHLDTEEAGGGLRARFLRNVYTRREGEFAALTEAEARRRLELGLDWFAARGWTPTGFVPPAWLLGEGAWRALRDAPFAYTTTFSHFHCLPGAREHQPGREGLRSAPPARERGKASRPKHGHERRDDYRGDDGAGVQSGSGAMQNGQRNQSRQDSPNSQFDRRDWTGPVVPDVVPDVARDARDRHGKTSQPANQPANQPTNQPTTQPTNQPTNQPAIQPAIQPDEQHPQAPRDPRAPFTQNNRHGTHAILSPSLVYAARNRSGRLLSPRVADATAAMLAHSPLVRFSLHPPDARYPELIRHIQRVLERLLERREAVTKAECARRLICNVTRGVTSTDPTSRPASNPDPSRSSPGPVHSAADHTSYSD
jgi:predicted deacetylase